MNPIAIACFALNNFGDGGPVATETTLQYFQNDHVCNCLRRMITSDNVTDAAKAVANVLLIETTRATKEIRRTKKNVR